MSFGTEVIVWMISARPRRVIGWKEHLLDELASSRRSVRTFERRDELRGETLPHFLTQRRRVDECHRADNLGVLVRQRERNHRTDAMPEYDAAAEAKFMG